MNEKPLNPTTPPEVPPAEEVPLPPDPQSGEGQEKANETVVPAKESVIPESPPETPPPEVPVEEKVGSPLSKEEKPPSGQDPKQENPPPATNSVDEKVTTKHQQQIRGLRDADAVFSGEIAKLKQAIDIEKRERDQARVEKERAQQERDQARAEKEQTLQETASLNKERQGLVRRNERLQQEFDTKQQRLTELEEKIRKREEESDKHHQALMAELERIIQTVKEASKLS